MNPQLMRRYLDIINEQSEFSASAAPPPPGYYEPPRSPIEGKWQPPPSPIQAGQPSVQNQEFIDQLDQAASSGTFDKSKFDASTADQKAMLLRNVDKFKQTNPNYDSSQQGAEARAATIQKQQDAGKITQSQAAKNKGSGEYFQPPAGEKTKTVTQKQPAVSTAPEKVEPYAAPVDFNARSGTVPVADTGLGKLSGGVSLGGSAGNFLTPQLRAELANQSGGKFYGDVGQSGQQFGYEQKFGDKATGQLAYRQTPGGGSSVGIGGSYDVTPNLKVTGGVSKSLQGQGGDRADIGLRYDFKESTKKVKRK